MHEPPQTQRPNSSQAAYCWLTNINVAPMRNLHGEIFSSQVKSQDSNQNDWILLMKNC